MFLISLDKMAKLTKKQLLRKYRKGRFGKNEFGGFCSGMIGVDDVVQVFGRTAAKKTPLGKKVRKFAKLERKFKKGVCGNSPFGREKLEKAAFFKD